MQTLLDKELTDLWKKTKENETKFLKYTAERKIKSTLRREYISYMHVIYLTKLSDALNELTRNQ